MFRFFLAGILFLAAGAATAAPEPYTLSGAQVRTLHSAKVGVDYRLLISLPRDHDRSKERYPLLITTDADYCFPLVHRISRFLSDHDELRPLIIVGIDYPGVADEKYGPILKYNRTRDYTPSRIRDEGYGKEANKDSGGADRFLDFIQQELLPYLTKELRVDPEDIGHVGYSYGGLLSCYAMMTRPGLFHRAIVVSPSLWHHDHMMWKVVEDRLPGMKDLKARAYFAIGSREEGKSLPMVSDMKSFVAKIEARHFKSFQARSWVGEDETHHSVFPAALMRGLRWTYSWE